ncbi:multicopper oxidase family protein (plasmid) [Halarchaeum sp. CBA1220]|uniref:Oxidase (Copper-binding protein) n=1 Tax=Halarchaeum grantii TaxID=1193105 RepID=A0A830F5B5_9EURY|nr:MULTISPECIES: multicopper oxidase family protein [Halarchaeum]QLC35489.1 multicopper oxidase family protein [Halarchaeum sp. CBA1220]GGL40643.1 putative oxidase (copper-binding protein) [Halarchaeum grantii]
MTDFTRRRFLAAFTGTGLSAFAGCATPFSRGGRGPSPPIGEGDQDSDETFNPPTYTPPEPTPLPDPDVKRTLRATAATITLGPNATSQSWVYDGQYVGPELRVSEGDIVEVALQNDLPAVTTTHWHGIPLQNAMDGVPYVTQDPVTRGSSFTYTFRAEPPGTYFYHSHVGLQLDRGLLGPLIIEEDDPHIDYDREFTVIFDDYLNQPPEPLSDDGRDGMGGMGGMMGSDVRPPYTGLLADGRLPSNPRTLDVAEGERIRFRFVNAASATEFRTRLAGHQMTVSHVDGRPVDPVPVDEFVFGPGERYDAVVELTNPGAWQLRAAAVKGDESPARLDVRYGGHDGTPQAPDWGGRRLQYHDLHARDKISVSGSPDRVYDLTLSRAGRSYTWLIDGQAYPNAEPLDIREGEHVRFRLRNHSPVTHPMHLHGHFFRVGDALMDTIRVPGHMGQVSLDFRADNPGNWLFHCHNLYHLESGMARVIRYV